MTAATKKTEGGSGGSATEAATHKSGRHGRGRGGVADGAKRDRRTEAAVDTFTEIAAAEGLLDVAYATADSPFGPLLLARTPTGLVRVGLPSEDADAMLVDLSQRISPRVLESAAALDEERRELDRYFAGKLDRFELPIDWQLSHGFHRRAREGMVAIPYGETRTYTELARGAGNERAVRAAGSACARNPIPLVVPCHRVLRSDGSLGGYAGGLSMKEGLLELEGARQRPADQPPRQNV